MLGIHHFEQHLCLPGLPLHDLMATTPVNLGERSMTQVLMLEGEEATGEAGKGAPGGILAPGPGPTLQIMNRGTRRLHHMLEATQHRCK